MDKLIIVHDTVTNLYCVKTSWNYNKLFVNNTEIKIDTNNIYGVGNFVVTKNKPETAYWLKVGKEIDYWKNVNTGDTKTIEEYEQIKQQLLKNVISIEVNYEYSFKTLEEQITWGYFQKSWNPVYKNIEEQIPLEIEIRNNPVSEYSEIKPSFSLEDVFTVKDGMFVYTPRQIEWFKEYCSKLGLTEGKDYEKDNKYYLPTHSGLEYAKINATYIFTGNDKHTFNSYRGKYEDCVNKLKQDKEKLRLHINAKWALISKKELPPTSISLIMNHLQQLDNINNLEVKNKSWNDFTSIKTKFSEFKQQFLKSLDNEHNY